MSLTRRRARPGLVVRLAGASATLVACSGGGSSAPVDATSRGDRDGGDARPDDARSLDVGARDAAPSDGETNGDTGTPTDAGTDSGKEAGDDAGSGLAAPTAFLLTAETPNSISLSWTAPPAEGQTIDHYAVYRDGLAYATSASTSYTDAHATNATVPLNGSGNEVGSPMPATIYSYKVAAVDSSGKEGAVQSQLTYWVYHDGSFRWQGDYSNVTADYNDTSGGPEDGAYDIKVSASVSSGYWQPYSGLPSAPTWAAEIGAFNYMTIDLKPTVANESWKLNIISRLPRATSSIRRNERFQEPMVRLRSWANGRPTRFR